MSLRCRVGLHRWRLFMVDDEGWALTGVKRCARCWKRESIVLLGGSSHYDEGWRP